ncbi:MAG: hypothetical protein LBC02_11770 [Planctomycetaceae bacterium]|jgi:hypothetical protein|nr:hypothetical protein [Planctomycetaceae bacterium]
MATNIEDFVKRITRINRKFTFIFTEDFFNIMGKNSVRTDRFKDIRNTFRYVSHRKGTNADLHVAEGAILFDVEVVVVDKGFSCFVTSFSELTNVPFSDQAIIYGLGNDQVDALKAKFQVDSFFAEKRNQSISTVQMLAERRKRQLILIVENQADLKRPSLEPIRKLRSQLCTILVNPEKGPVVDCQVSKLFQEGNSSSLSTLLNMFCVHYS